MKHPERVKITIECESGLKMEFSSIINLENFLSLIHRNMVVLVENGKLM